MRLMWNLRVAVSFFLRLLTTTTYKLSVFGGAADLEVGSCCWFSYFCKRRQLFIAELRLGQVFEFKKVLAGKLEARKALSWIQLYCFLVRR